LGAARRWTDRRSRRGGAGGPSPGTCMGRTPRPAGAGHGPSGAPSPRAADGTVSRPRNTFEGSNWDSYEVSRRAGLPGVPQQRVGSAVPSTPALGPARDDGQALRRGPRDGRGHGDAGPRQPGQPMDGRDTLPPGEHPRTRHRLRARPDARLQGADHEAGAIVPRGRRADAHAQGLRPLPSDAAGRGEEGDHLAGDHGLRPCEADRTKARHPGTRH
jgi:hypothetical protein